MHTLREVFVNLNQYPTPITKHSNDSELTIGDLHSNAVKLLYFLIREGILFLSTEDYYTFRYIYKHWTPNNRSTILDGQLKNIKGILSRARAIPNSVKTIRLLGDTIADRGKCDVFMFLIFKKLAENQIPFKILLSNHDFEFILQYQAFKKSTHYLDLMQYAPKSPEYQASLKRCSEAGFLPANPCELFSIASSCTESLFSLGQLFHSGILSVHELDEYVTQYYLPYVQALDYTHEIHKNRLAIYSHAPIGLNTLLYLHQGLKSIATDSQEEVTLMIDTDETTEESLIHPSCRQWMEIDSAIELMKVIDEINQKIKPYLVENNIGDLWYPRPSRTEDDETFAEHLHAFYDILWNRNYKRIIRPEIYEDFSLLWVHGHDSTHINDHALKHVINLDNQLGKYNAEQQEDHFIDYYSIMVSITGPVSQLEETPKKTVRLTSTPIASTLSILFHPIEKPLPVTGNASETPATFSPPRANLK